MFIKIVYLIVFYKVNILPLICQQKLLQRLIFYDILFRRFDILIAGLLKWLKEVAMTKTINYCFGKRNRPKQGADKADLLAPINDYATVEGEALTEISSSHLSICWFAFNLI